MIKDLLNKLAEIQSALDLANIQKQELIDQVLTPEIRERIAEIESEFAPAIEAATGRAAELEARIKQEVAATGASIKGDHLQAVYSKPRVSWDTAKLDGMMALIPQLKEARKEGAPSVSIRKVG